MRRRGYGDPDSPRHRGATAATQHGRALAALLLTCSLGVAQGAEAPTFAEVAPLLQARCTVCHAGAAAVMGLRLDTVEGVLAGSVNGAVVVPGEPAASELLRRVRGERLPRMPLTGPPFLNAGEIALLDAWIAAGAPGGDAAAAPAPAPVPPRPRPGEPVTYAQVAPILLQRCARCHAERGSMGPAPEGLRLLTREQTLAGGERTVVVPGVPAASELLRRVRGLSLPRMPFDGPPYLGAAEIDLLTAWVAQGARDERGERAPVPVGAPLRLEGVLSERWRLDDLELVVGPQTRVRGVQPGDRVEVRGTLRADGRLAATRIRAR